MSAFREPIAPHAGALRKLLTINWGFDVLLQVGTQVVAQDRKVGAHPDDCFTVAENLFQLHEVTEVRFVAGSMIVRVDRQALPPEQSAARQPVEAEEVLA